MPEPVKPLRIVQQSPIGQRVVQTLHGPITLPEYPSYTKTKGKDLRDLRLDLGLGLRAGAAALGLTALETSGIERGAFACDWAEAARRLEAHAKETGATPSTKEERGAKAKALWDQLEAVRARS